MISDETDARLLGVLQREVPFVERPFALLGYGCGIGEDEVLERLRRLKAEKIIRQISAIFDTRSLGYASSLVAARVAPDMVDEAAEIVGRIPG